MHMCVYLILTSTKKKKQRRTLDRFRVEFILLDRVAWHTSNEETFKYRSEGGEGQRVI